MFREMGRGAQALPMSRCEEILRRGSSGVLALAGDDGYPYALPISYLYDGQRLYFHCALTGHKIDAIRRCEKASFCVIDQDKVVPERFTTHYRSVITFGRMRILKPGEEFDRAILCLAQRYAPGMEEAARRETEKYRGALCMLAMDIDHMTGKQCRELMGT